MTGRPERTGGADPRPLYLDLTPDPVFGVFHPSRTTSPTATAVLIVPPFGWLDVASYRSRRTWAEALADGGHPTLRIDLPGTGDSGGDAGDPRRVDAWVAAVEGAAAWLRDQPGVERVALIGLGLGGIIAARAVDAGAAIDDLVLWATPAQGRQHVRQERAFAGMQGSRYSLTGEPEPQVLPDGWLEVNGFVLSADTLADLGAIDLRTMATAGLRRALLLEADGLPPDPALHERLAAGGVDVTVAPGPGWGSMTFHPERSESPAEVIATVGAWLAAAPGDAPDRAVGTDRRPAPVAHDAATIAVEGGLVRESPVWVDGPAGPLFGLLAEPAGGGGSRADDPDRAPVVAVFLNAGAVRRIGPNRLWVETARRWAARGVPSLRVDLEGIGDAEGDSARFRDVIQFYRPEIGDQVRAFADAMVARGAGTRVVLVGMCAGGYWAFQGADRDPRVSAAFLLNPGALVWHDRLVRRRDARKVRRLLQPAWWGRLIRGQVRLARIRTVAHAVASAPTASRDRSAYDPEPIMARLRDRGTDVLLAFSWDEGLEAELATDGALRDGSAWPNLVRDRLPGRDHTLRPIVAQVGVRTVLDTALERELARTAPARTEPAPLAAVGGHG